MTDAQAALTLTETETASAGREVVTAHETPGSLEESKVVIRDQRSGINKNDFPQSSPRRGCTNLENGNLESTQ